MSIAIVLTGAKDVRLVHWAARIAQARQQPLHVIWAVKRRGETKRASSIEAGDVPPSLTQVITELDLPPFRAAHEEQPESDQPSAESTPHLPIHVVSISSEKLAPAIETEVSESGASCLILARDSGERLGALHEHLLANVECEIVVITPGERSPDGCREIITPVGEGPHSASCLRLANDMAESAKAKLVAIHVEPDLDEVSPLAALRTLTKTVNRALGSPDGRVEKRVAMSRDVVEGIAQCVGDSSDLIILGMKRHGIVRRFSSQGVAERLVNAKLGPDIAVLQSAMPLSSRFVHWLDDVLRGNVPQLPREQRVRLVEQIQRSSRWDFDFILLICMSTLIAAGGLIQNSPAVVIGAMLVAPLMTPLLGTGLSLVQGNVVLFQSTLMTVLRGFVVAFLISFGVGLLTSPDITSEMMARGTPRVLDIAVAMVGGIAAAYASGRPNLLSALPGVAIAASLVPPIATSGIAAWAGRMPLALGAALLFFTNIVAIVLGTAIAFRAVGIRGSHQHGNVSRWTMFASSALLITILGLGIYEARPRSPVSSDMHAALAEIALEHEARIESISHDQMQDQPSVRITLRGPAPLPAETLQSMRDLVFQEMDGVDAVEVNLEISSLFSK